MALDSVSITVLATLSDGPKTLDKVVKLSGLDKREVEGVLLRLVAGGYVEREERSRLFLTRVEYRLTEFGRTELRRAEEELRAKAEALKAAAERKDREEMRKLAEEHGEWIPAMLLLGLLDAVYVANLLGFLSNYGYTAPMLGQGPMYEDMWGWEDEEANTDTGEGGEW